MTEPPRGYHNIPDENTAPTQAAGKGKLPPVVGKKNSGPKPIPRATQLRKLFQLFDIDRSGQVA